MEARYYFGTDRLVHERKETQQRRIVCDDGIERDVLIQWEPVDFGDGDLIDRWVIEWWDESAKQKRTFFATFATLEEADDYLTEWAWKLPGSG